jgi:hypothetical protein
MTEDPETWPVMSGSGSSPSDWKCPAMTAIDIRDGAHWDDTRSRAARAVAWVAPHSLHGAMATRGVADKRRAYAWARSFD